jgi:Rod binding domain-containing protein
MAADPISSISLGSVALTSTAANGKPANAKEAATQFEGLLISEMLHSAHESNPGSLSGDEEDDAEGDTAFGIAAEQFAQLMAKQGGFGIAKLVSEGLSREPSNQARAATGTSPPTR